MAIGADNLKILYASSEVYPLMKTGGLADVAQSLPATLHAMGSDIRIIMPNYGSINSASSDEKTIAQFEVGGEKITLIETHISKTRVPVILVDCPTWFGREGNPYLDSKGIAWTDNAQRFAMFSKVVSLVAQNKTGLAWKPNIVHCNDWQTGLTLTLLKHAGIDKGLVFTIHNIAYQGVFPRSDFVSLQLPEELWSIETLEYYGQMSFLKGGIVSCNQLNTVSPKFAEEIQTSEYGFGMDGLLKSNSDKLRGIINGVDLKEWSPKEDSFLSYRYGIQDLQIKSKNKLELQERFGLTVDVKIPLFASITRLVEQKGVDLIIDILDKLLALDVQFIILGSGEEKIEKKLRNFAQRNKKKLHAEIRYDESLAHKLTAAADIYLMPSRFEPCGLNQMYSQLYGTVPIVRNSGGLADTVINYTKGQQGINAATGFMFEKCESNEFFKVINQALDCYKNVSLWKQLQINGMQQDFSWQTSSKNYISMYEEALR